MPEASAHPLRYLAPAPVAEVLGIGVDEVIDLVLQGSLRGARLGSPAAWRIEEASIGEYLAAQAEEARRIALWRQADAASFPELWGPLVRLSD
ncbi:DNA-binding protein [uncultured Microbacterium sp.]|uniref:DNA-binding protein n=1 Tax=uncultured Microbacterium sp. TaxID=191216 RepID=UPI0025F84259|nr:DNA-binding protein [uncultured Microbacterium sp.]